jgi:putative hemolysin
MLKFFIYKASCPLDPDSSHFYTLLPLLLTSLFFSGFISAYEASLSALPRLRLQNRAEEGDPRSQYLLQLIEKPHQTLLTLMVCDWLADVTFLVLSALLISAWFPGPWAPLLAILILTPTLLIAGEILPKAVASRWGEKFAYTWLPVLRMLLAVFSVPVSLMNLFTKPFLDIVGARFGQLVPDFTEEEIMQMVNFGGNTGMLDKQETALVQSAFTFDDKPASAVLTPRVDMICIPHTCTVEDALEIMTGEEGYSRLPVYKDNLDNIIGIVHIKDLLRIRQKANGPCYVPVSNDMRKAHHIHEFQSINLVLKEMQARRQPMFIVTDEYGGTVGLVTMEDLLEEIVGEIHDEYDEEEAPMLEKGSEPHQVFVDARISVSEVNEVLGLDLPNSQSVAALVFNTLGEVPGQGQLVQIGNAELRVEQIDGIRIQRVQIRKLLESGLTPVSTDAA